MIYRNEIKQILVVTIAIMLVFQPIVHAATISTNKIIITSDEKIIIHYQITGKGTYTVSAKVSLDAGRNFTITPLALSGDVGKGVTAGENKQIEWDAFQDVKQLSGTMVIMLEAVKEPGKPINKWLVLGGLLLAGGAISAMGGGGGGKSISDPTSVVITHGFIRIDVVFPE